MPDFALPNTYDFVEAYNGDTSTSTRQTISNTGVWNELIASTSEQCDFLYFSVEPGSTAILQNCSADLGVGGSGSEEIIIEGVQLYGKSSGNKSQIVWAPISIPAGSRVSVRFNNDADAKYIQLILFKGSFAAGPAMAEVFRTDDSINNAGVTIDPGATANTKGAWTEVEASTLYTMNGFYLVLGANDNNATTIANFLIEVAVGGSGSEEIISGDIAFGQTATELSVGSYYIPVKVAQGQRISVRAQCSITDANDRLIDASIVGIR